MKSNLRIVLLVTVLVTGLIWSSVAGSSVSFAEDMPELLPQWRINGSLSMKGDNYQNNGNAAVAPYRYEGSHYQFNVDLDFDRKFSDYETLQGQFSGRSNHSDYVTDFNGWVSDRFTLTWQKGDAPVPFRATGGDFYGFFTPRTVQRSLKGFQVELQPRVSRKQRYSLQFFGGAVQPSYRDMDFKADRSFGGSLLIDAGKSGVYSLNLVKNKRAENPLTNLVQLNQTLISLSGNRELNILGEDIGLDGEFGYFYGDIDNAGVASTDRGDESIFLQLSRRTSGALTYQFTHERYGDEYQPLGGAVSADRRADSGNVGWRFDNGLNLQVRFQNDHSNISQADPNRNTILGATLGGGLSLIGLEKASFNYDIYQQNTRTQSHSTHSRALANNFSLSSPLNEAWNGTLSLQYQDQNDLVGTTDSLTRQISCQLNRVLEFLKWRGSISPGLTFVDTLTDIKTENINLNLGINMANGPHSIQFSYSDRDQQNINTPGTDVITRDFNLVYGFNTGQHRVTFNCDWQRRRDEAADRNRSYHFGLQYVFSFDRPAKRLVAKSMDFSSDKTLGPFDLTELVPGIPLEQAVQYLDLYNVTPLETLSCCRVFEKRLFARIPERQRIFLETDEGLLNRSGILVDITSSTTAELRVKTFLGIIAQQYGAPVTAIEEGNFTANMVDDIQAGRLVRLYEWRTPSGRLRFGLPRRLDRTVRMELQHGNRLPPRSDLNWSVEEIR